MKKGKDKKVGSIPINWLIDEAGHFDFKLHKNKEQSWINLPIFTDEEE